MNSPKLTRRNFNNDTERSRSASPDQPKFAWNRQPQSDDSKKFTKLHMVCLAFFLNLPWVVSETGLAMVVVLVTFSCLSFVYERSDSLFDIGFMPIMFLSVSMILYKCAIRAVWSLAYPPLLAGALVSVIYFGRRYAHMQGFRGGRRDSRRVQIKSFLHNYFLHDRILFYRKIEDRRKIGPVPPHHDIRPILVSMW